MPTDSLISLIAYEAGVWAIMGVISRIVRVGMRAKDRGMPGVIIPNVSAFLIEGTIMAYGSDTGRPEWLVGFGGAVVPLALWVWYDARKLRAVDAARPPLNEQDSTSLSS